MRADQRGLLTDTSASKKNDLVATVVAYQMADQVARVSACPPVWTRLRGSFGNTCPRRIATTGWAVPFRRAA